MAASAAHITSIEALRALKAALVQFDEEVHGGLVTLELEARRPREWIEHDRAQYWPREVRKASDALSEARLALQRCELTISGDDRRSCYDERKALERAKRRLHSCEEKVQAVRRWQPQIRKAIEEFEVELAKLQQYLESDFQRAAGALDRMAEALDRYVRPGPAPGAAAPATSGEDPAAKESP